MEYLSTVQALPGYLADQEYQEDETKKRLKFQLAQSHCGMRIDELR